MKGKTREKPNILSIQLIRTRIILYRRGLETLFRQGVIYLVLRKTNKRDSIWEIIFLFKIFLFNWNNFVKNFFL